MERALREKLKVGRGPVPRRLAFGSVAVLLFALALVATTRARPGEAKAGARGLPISMPAAQGMDAHLLQRGDTFVRRRLLDVKSFLVVRHGKLVFERYYYGGSSKTSSDVQSVTKSVIS